MKKPELLAPAGSMKAFYAAIEAGCDAVYIGGYSFGARAFSDNFSNEEIIECINYAHKYGVKVYVTVNTLIFENEVEIFLNYIDFLHQNNVDAVIVQDLGMFDLIRKTYLNLEIHISTQMHIHNLNGTLMMEKLGAKRVVLARETDFETLKQIKEKTNIELEVFVHGALCVSYSGQCLMSYLIGGRSGNRGKCAGTCRQMYSLVDETGKKYNKDNYLLSMKDLNILENIGKLIDLGIDSFKIEGRMKRPEYVYLVVSIYRKAIDSYLKEKKINITEEDIMNLYKIYNRKFTKGYLFEKNVINQYRPNHLGINIGKVIKKDNHKIYIKLTDNLRKGDGIRFLNQKEDTGLTITKIFVQNKDVNEAFTGDIVVIKDDIDCDANAIVIKTTDKKQLDDIENKLKNKTRKIFINGKITIKNGLPLELIISDETNIVNYKSDYIVDKAINRIMTNEDIEKNLRKTNDTIYSFNNIEINNDYKSFIPIFKLNEIRRNALALLDKKRMYKIPYKKEKYTINVPDFKQCEKVNLLIRNENLYNKVKHFKYDTLYLDENLFNKINDSKKVLKLSRVINKSHNYDLPLLVSEIGSLKEGVFTDFSFNVTNSYTVALLHSIGVQRITLSYELDYNQIKDIVLNYHKRYHKRPNLEVIVYGREEAMISKFNLLNGKNLSLKDKYGNIFPIKENKDFMTIFNYKIENRKENYYDIGINYIRYDFLSEKELDVFNQ